MYRQVLRKYFDLWNDYIERLPVSSVVLLNLTGVQVWTILKWISLTIGQEAPSYSFRPYFIIPQHESATRSGVEKLEYSTGRHHPRYRMYLLGLLHFSEENRPLVLHAIALLDAFQQRHFFNCWKTFTRQLIDNRHRLKCSQLRSYLMKWKQKVFFRKRLASAETTCMRKLAWKLCHTTFYSWILEYKVRKRQRLVVRPQLLYRLLRQLTFLVSSQRTRKLLISYSIFYRYRKLCSAHFIILRDRVKKRRYISLSCRLASEGHSANCMSRGLYWMRHYTMKRRYVKQIHHNLSQKTRIKGLERIFGFLVIIAAKKMALHRFVRYYLSICIKLLLFSKIIKYILCLYTFIV